MNDRSTILKIIRHPLIKELIENKMATSSVITKLIAEELTLNEAFTKPQEIIDALKVLQTSSEKIPEVAAFLEKIKTSEFDKKLYRAAAMKSHPDRGGDEETFKAIGGFKGIDQNLLKQTIQQAGGGQASPQQGQGEAASEEVLASVKQVIEKYQKGYESFVQMIADLKQDPALYYTDEKIQQIYKNLGALQEEVDLNQLKDPDPKKSFEKAAKALEVVKNKILQLIKSKLSDSKKQQVQEAEEKDFVAVLEQIMEKYKNIYDDLKNELKPDMKSDADSLLVLFEYFKELNEVVKTQSYMKQLKNFAGKNQWAKAAEQAVLGLRGSIKNIFSFAQQVQKQPNKAEALYNNMERFMKFYEQAAGIMQFAKEKSTGTELVVKTKKGEVVPVKPDDQKKIVQIFELIQDWITIYKFIITQFAEDVKVLGGDPQKQLPPPAVKLLTTKVQLLLPPPEKLLPVPFEPETEELPDEPEEEEAEEKPEPTEPADEQPPEPINKEDVENYIEALQEFLDNFMKVRTLKEQSDIFYKFQQSVFKLTGKPTDEIVGDQIAALTRTAQNLTEQEEPKTAQNSAVKGESKDILTGAQVTQRHVKAVQQIMNDYQEYLGEFGSKKGVTVGSRKMFDKFGVSNPKELLYKFVKLLANDINQMVEKMNSMKQKIKAASEKTEKPPEEKEQEQELNEEKKKMSLKEKIDLVEEVYIYVRKNGVDLRDAISQFVEEAEADKGKEKAGEDEEKEESGQESQPSAEPQVQKEQEEVGVGGVATTGAKGRTKEKAGAGAEKDETIGARTGRPDKEVYGNYKQIALDIDDQLERIANFFPTARPFDSKYTMKQAQKSFLTVIKKLDTVVANVKNFLRDEDINVPTLNDLTQELLAIKEVMKSIFGLTDEQQQAENQGAISDAGEESGLPQAPDKEGESTAKDPNELKQKMDSKIKEAQNTIEIARFITAQPPTTDAKTSAEFFGFISKTSGFIRNLQLSVLRSSNKGIARTLQRTELPIDKLIKDYVIKGDLKGNLNNLMSAIAKIYYKFKDSTTTSFKESLLKEQGSQTSRIMTVGKLMIRFITLYNILKVTSEEMGTRETRKELDLTEQKIKELDEFVKDLTETFTEIQTIIKQYPAKNIDKDIKVDDFYSYYHFDKFKSFGLSIDADLEADEAGKKPSKEKDNEESPVEPEQEEEIVDNLENEEDQNTDQEGYAFVEDEELEDIIDAEIIEVVPDLEDKPEERKRLTQKIIPLLTDKTNEQETEQKQIAQKEIEDIKKENSEADAEEVIEQAAQKLLTDSGGDISEEDAKEVAQDAFISHTAGIKQQRADAYKQAGFVNDMYTAMGLDEQRFPGFKDFSEEEQRAIAVFMTFISPDFDETALQEQEIGAEKTFEAYLTGYGIKGPKVKEMLKLMQKKNVLKTFKRLLGDDENRKKIRGYAKNFTNIPEEPEKPKDSKKSGAAGKKVGLDALVKEKIQELLIPLIKEMLNKGK